MKPLRIFLHVNREPLTYLEKFLAFHGYPYEVVCLDECTDVSMELDCVAGLVFMGGAGDVNQPTGFMLQELELIKLAASKAVPMLGVCLGAQLISKALGGNVLRGYSLEVGWHSACQYPESENFPWFSDLPDKFEVFQWHAHVFSLPPEAFPIAYNNCHELQAFAMDNILAMQFHLEMTADLIDFLIDQYKSDLQEDSECVQSETVIKNNLASRIEQLNDTAGLVYSRWLQQVYAVNENNRFE